MESGRLALGPAGGHEPRMLLIGPFDPHCGEYTFLAPPLGVWRLAGVLHKAGVAAEVFDPNCCRESPQKSLTRILIGSSWDVIGVSTTSMTLPYDLELAHLARRIQPGACIVAGGMEATFRPRLMFDLGPFDFVVLGEGEQPLLEMAARLRMGAALDAVPGCVPRRAWSGTRLPVIKKAMSIAELTEAVFSVPYERMPYAEYWTRLEEAFRVDRLPSKAQREASLAEIRSVRLMTLNYCPMNCSFCSATNFLRTAQGSVAAVARLDAEACLAMIRKIVNAQPGVRTVIFQDDIFVFTRDRRILELCHGICEAKARGEIPMDLQFISTNRVDSMDGERLNAMRTAGFRVLGFGIESFSRRVLAEFNKEAIHRHVEPVLEAALSLGITPFLDLILTSPKSSIGDLAHTLRSAFQWIVRGCEVGIYPYVIPFAGAPMASDPALAPHTVSVVHRIRGTAISWEQAVKILPADPYLRAAIQRIEERFEIARAERERSGAHLPSRVRSLLWILAAAPVMAEYGHDIADPAAVERVLEGFAPAPAKLVRAPRVRLESP